MTDAIIDASPLIFLAKIGRLNLLNHYRLFIPRQVEEEILKGAKKQRKNALSILKFFKNTNIEKVNIDLLEALPSCLGKGERSVISYAVHSGINEVLIDESKARTVARFYKLKPKGTLGILNDALKRKAIVPQELEELVFDLVREGYRIKEEILIEFLKKIRG